MKNATKAMKMELAAALGYLPEIRVPRWKKLINWMLYRVAGRVLRVPMDRPGSQGEAYPAPRSGQPYRLSEDPKRRIEQVKLCHESDKLKARMTADIERVVNQSQAESQAFWQKYDQARCDDQEMADPSGVVRPTIQTSGSNLPANTLTVAEQAVLVQTLGSGEHRPFRLLSPGLVLNGLPQPAKLVQMLSSVASGSLNADAVTGIFSTVTTSAPLTAA